MAAIAINAIFGNDDLRINGDILISLPKGEIYDATAVRQVITVTDLPGRNEDNNFAVLATDRNVANAILVLNFETIRAGLQALGNDVIADYAYLRFLALKYNLCSVSFTGPTIKNCYNEVKYARHNNANLSANEVIADDNAGVPQARKRVVAQALGQRLTDVRCSVLNKCFRDIVCLMAFMFRTRGHHWLPNYDAAYNRLWRKCAAYNEIGDLNWSHITTIVLHAIPPNVLDNYWVTCARNDTCDVILSLRISSLAAGTSVYGIIANSISDLTATFPNLLKKLDREVDHVTNAYDEIKKDRWAHSINARFYGSDNERLPEANIGSLGSIIKSCIHALNEDHPINASPALERVANLAPITGSVYSRTIREYIGSGEFARQLQLS